MKILVTGATGFIGNYVIAQLLQKGHYVIATSSCENKAKEASWYPHVKYIALDLKHIDEHINYYRHFDNPDIAIHLAWGGLPNYKEAFHIQDNLPFHYIFLKNLLQNGLPDLTVTGTCLEYGMKEGCLREDMESEPGNPYAVAKNELRKKLEQMAEQKGINFKWIRLFYMYGKGQSPKSLISQLDKALEAHELMFNMSGGEQVRDFLPVEKVAEYIVLVALQNKVNGIVNCCSGKPVMVKQFVLNYLEQQGKTIQLNLGYYPYPDYEPMSFWGDDEKLKSIIL